MICKPANPATLGCVNELQNGLRNMIPRLENITRLILLEHHEIEMLDTFLSIFSHALFE